MHDDERGAMGAQMNESNETTEEDQVNGGRPEAGELHIVPNEPACTSEQATTTTTPLPIPMIGDKFHIQYFHGLPIEGPFRQVIKVLLTIDDLYNHNGVLTAVRGGQFNDIDTVPLLQSLLMNVAEFEEIRPQGASFKLLNPDIARAIMEGLEERKLFKPLKSLTRGPVYMSNWELTQPGYNPIDQIYYEGPAIVPVRTRTFFDQMIYDFPWREEADKANYVAAHLTMMLMPHFVHGHPAVLVNGNQPNIGKTMLIRLMGAVHEGKDLQTLSYNKNGAELEKNLASRVKRQNIILIDNVRTKAAGKDTIDSAELERCLTDWMLSFRKLGFNKLIERANDLMFAITVNHAKATLDLITRCMSINLEVNGDPLEIKFKTPHIFDFALNHRCEMLAELAGMVEAWKEADMPETAEKSRFNISGWAPKIGGILKVNGINGFLENYERILKEYNPVEEELIELAEGHLGKRMTAKAWCSIARTRGAFKSLITSPTVKGQDTQFGLYLKRKTGTVLNLGTERPGPFVKLEVIKHADRTEYVFVEVKDKLDA